MAGAPELDADGRGGELLTDGVYARIRHPRYVAVTLGVIAWALFTNFLGMYLLIPISVAGLLLIASIEERELVRRFGEEYAAYRSRVPMFIPRFGADS
jgi:protein-S-isoprenylcysteine O-methyltransferase Ste14